MTQLQKDVLVILLNGGSIAFGGTKYRVRNASHEPVLTVGYNTYYRVRQTKCLRQKNGVMVLDKRKVRQLHGNEWLKREYKSKMSEQ